MLGECLLCAKHGKARVSHIQHSPHLHGVIYQGDRHHRQCHTPDYGTAGVMSRREEPGDQDTLWGDLNWDGDLLAQSEGERESGSTGNAA